MTGRRVLVAVGAGIAAYKVPELVRALRRAGHAVRCVLSESAAHFVTPLSLQAVSGQPVRSQLFDATEEGQIDHIASRSLDPHDRILKKRNNLSSQRNRWRQR